MEAKKTGKPTQRDVARAAGVSVATVSYVLSGKRGGCAISPATEARIRRAAEELGYQKNADAAALSASTSQALNNSLDSLQTSVSAAHIHVDRRSEGLEVSVG